MYALKVNVTMCVCVRWDRRKVLKNWDDQSEFRAPIFNMLSFFSRHITTISLFSQKLNFQQARSFIAPEFITDTRDKVEVRFFISIRLDLFFVEKMHANPSY